MKIFLQKSLVTLPARLYYQVLYDSGPICSNQLVTMMTYQLQTWATPVPWSIKMLSERLLGYFFDIWSPLSRIQIPCKHRGNKLLLLTPTVYVLVSCLSCPPSLLHFSLELECNFKSTASFTWNLRPSATPCLLPLSP